MTNLLLRDVSPSLSMYSNQVANVQLPVESHSHKGVHYAQDIARFCPTITRIVRANKPVCHAIHVFAHNGRKYSFIVESVACRDTDGSQQRVAQLFKFLNALLAKDCQTARRLLYFSPPTSIPLGTKHRLVATVEHEISLIDVLAKQCAAQSMGVNDLIVRYYDRVALSSSLGQQKLLQMIVKDAISEYVPRSTLSSYVMRRLPDPTHYYTFRNQFCTHLSLLNIAETALHLTRLDAQDVIVQMDTGVTSTLSFIVHIKSTDANSAELDNSDRAVTCRLTPSIVDFVTTSQIDGKMWANMTAAAKCWYQAVVAALLRPILWHEFIQHLNKQRAGDGTTTTTVSLSNGTSGGAAGGHELLTMVARATGKITSTLSSYALCDTNVDRTPIHTLLLNSRSLENVAKMDPTWHPWF